MFGIFDSKKKKKKKPQTSEEIRDAALAQFRKTENELGEETITAMRKAMEFEQAKKQIKDAIDDKEGFNREAVLENLKDIMNKDD